MTCVKGSIIAAALLMGLSLCSTTASAQMLSSNKEYNIRAQPLEDALIEYSRVSGVQVIASSDIVANKRTGAFRKTSSASEALTEILAGTGLTYRPVGNATVTIVRLTSESANHGVQYAAAEQQVAATDAVPQTESAVNARSDTGVEQVIVTAQKRKQALSKVPLAVTAFQGDKLEEHGQRSVTDFIGEAPGVSVRPSNSGFASVQIRGISSATGDGTVGFYLDEIPFSVVTSTIGPNMRSFDLDRVEVLRGPQGTLYGQGSMGGTIKLITKAPDLDEFGAKIDLTAGIKEDGEPNYVTNGALNIPLIEGKLAVRLVGGYQQNGGFLDDNTTGNRDVNDFTSRNFRAKVLFSPNDDLRITASAWFERDKSDFSLGGFDDRTLSSGPGVDFLGVDSDIYNLTVEYALPFADLTSSTSQMTFAYDASNFSTFITPFTTNVSVDSGLKNRIFAQEMRLVSSEDGPLQWSVGGLYTNVKADAAALVDVQTIIPSVVTVGTLTDTTGEIKSKTWAVFGEVSYSLFDGRVEPLIGLRYFEDERGGFAQTVNSQFIDFVDPLTPDITVPPTTGLDVEEGTFHTLNPRFNVAFHMNDNWMSYVNVAKGFRSGAGNGALARAIAASYGVNADTVNPDVVWSYEAGTKATFMDGTVSVEAALYYNSWDDIQILVTDPLTFTSFIVNGGTAHTKGIEYNVTYRPTSNLTLQVSGNFNNSELDKIDANLATLTFLKSGDPLDFVPATQVNGSFTYAWPLEWIDDAQGYLYGAVNYNSPQSRTTTSGVLTGDAITAVNIRGGVQKDNWGAFLFVDNLFDEDGRVTNNTDGTGERLQPRVIGVNFRYSTD